MKTDNALRDLLYISVGWASFMKNKLEDMMEDLVRRNEVTKEEGKRILHELEARSDMASKQFEMKREEFIEKLAHTSSMGVAEVRHIFNEVLEKPKEAREDLKHKIEEFIERTAVQVDASSEEVRRKWSEFMDEVEEAQQGMGNKIDKMIADTKDKYEDTGGKLANFTERLRCMGEESGARLEYAISTLANKFHLLKKDKTSEQAREMSN